MSDLRRSLGTRDAVVIGLGSMVGAGVFSAFGPAAAAAGDGLAVALLLAAVVAYCNATSSARLAAVHPASGGTYVYGTRQLGSRWGHLAGWSFVVGKTASCAAMAMTVGAYAWPGHERAVAVATVAVLVLVNLGGVQKSAGLTRLIVSVVLVILAVWVVALWVGSAGAGAVPQIGVGSGSEPGGGPGGLLQAAGLLFFAFAGYARIATLGEEVRNPARTIPRAIPLALAITMVVYAVVAVTLLHVLGVSGLSGAGAPMLDAAVHGPSWLPPLVRGGAVIAATGSLLGLILGVSRTSLAMARDGHLPRALSAVSSSHGVPWAAEICVAVVVVGVVLVADLRGAIGFSSFGVLVYYAIANASAWTLRPDQGRPPVWVPVVGGLGCGALALSLPAASVVAGGVVVLLGLVAYQGRQPGDEHRPTL